MKRQDANAFDLHTLQSGDAVEVFLDAEHKWCRGTFEITTDGSAIVALPGGLRLELAAALLAGIRPAAMR